MTCLTHRPRLTPSRRIGGLEKTASTLDVTSAPSRRIGGLESQNLFLDGLFEPSRRIGGLETAAMLRP